MSLWSSLRGTPATANGATGPRTGSGLRSVTGPLSSLGPLSATGQLAAVLPRVQGGTTTIVRLGRQYVAPALATVGRAGRFVLATAVTSWVLAAVFGWSEMSILATACLFILGLAALFMIGATKLDVQAIVEPPRVTVGEPLAGELSVRNAARTPLTSARLEFPIGQGGVSIDLPPLLPDRSYSELFSIPTSRRGVIQIGPATSVRGDPLGLLRRELAWTERTEVFVHPRITPLAPIGSGLVRDLEGNAAQNLSASDFAFQSLREYVPGDDLRHVHWRSSARHGQLLVRQYLDTRRSHLTAIVDSDPLAYGTEDDYETAISAAASLIVRGLRDGYDVSFLSGAVAATKATGRAALDACARAEPLSRALLDVALDASRRASDTSIVFLITGTQSDYTAMRRAASQFGLETARVALRVDSTAMPGLRSAGDLPVLSIAQLEQLPTVLRWGL